MATLERRVQVLFNPAQYAALEEEAATLGQSVGSLIRESVDERLRRRRVSHREAVELLLGSAEANRGEKPIDWAGEKYALDDDFESRLKG